jgi:hypothetical protein
MYYSRYISFSLIIISGTYCTPYANRGFAPLFLFTAYLMKHSIAQVEQSNDMITGES